MARFVKDPPKVSEAPTADEMELFFWQVFGTQHPAMTFNSLYGNWEVNDHTWLHKSFPKIRRRYILKPIMKFNFIARLADETGSYGSTVLLTKVKSLTQNNNILIFKIRDRASPIDLYIYNDLFLIVESDKLMFSGPKFFLETVETGMLDGSYIGMQTLPNSTFINYALSKISKTSLLAIQEDKLRQELDD